MNRLTLLVLASVLSLTLLAGCEKRPSLTGRRKQGTKQRTNTVAAVKPPKKQAQHVNAPQPKPAITAGSAKYLDYKNGFRDAVLGRKESSFTNLVLKTQDDQRAIKTFTRPDEELSLDGIPLESIEYSFFKGQLFQISIKWRIEQKDPAQGTPSVVTLAPFFANLYGPPRHRVIKKGGTDLRWRGQQVALTLSESVIPGVRDSLKGGWAIRPVTSGLMVMERIDLSKAVTAMLVSAKEARKDGL